MLYSSRSHIADCTWWDRLYLLGKRKLSYTKRTYTRRNQTNHRKYVRRWCRILVKQILSQEKNIGSFLKLFISSNKNKFYVLKPFLISNSIANEYIANEYILRTYLFTNSIEIYQHNLQIQREVSQRSTKDVTRRQEKLYPNTNLNNYFYISSLKNFNISTDNS